MTSSTDRLWAKLVGASAWTELAMEPYSSKRLRKDATNKLLAALRAFESDETILEQLMLAASIPTDHAMPADLPGQGASSWRHAGSELDHQSLAEGLAGLMTDQQARLLVLTGYKTPPPPRAQTLLYETQRLIRDGAAGPVMTAGDVEGMYEAVRELIATIESHMGSGFSRVKLGLTRRAVLTGMLLVIATHVEVKPGDEFAITPIFSLKDWVKVEVSVPAEFAAKKAREALLRGAVRATRGAVIRSGLVARQEFRPQEPRSVNQDMTRAANINSRRRPREIENPQPQSRLTMTSDRSQLPALPENDNPNER